MDKVGIEISTNTDDYNKELWSNGVSVYLECNGMKLYRILYTHIYAGTYIYTHKYTIHTCAHRHAYTHRNKHTPYTCIYTVKTQIHTHTQPNATWKGNVLLLISCL